MGITDLCEQNPSSPPHLDRSERLQPLEAKGASRQELRLGTEAALLVSGVCGAQWFRESACVQLLNPGWGHRTAACMLQSLLFPHVFQIKHNKRSLRCDWVPLQWEYREAAASAGSQMGAGEAGEPSGM